jgi:Helix-turn-helix domain/RodZ C-terminal domain
MFAIGNSLREARTNRGLSAADVQKGIRIRERYLTALEEEQWDLLPGEAYTKGFLRTYAEFLGLDGNLYVDEYNTRIAHHDEDRLLVPQSLTPGHRKRRGVLRTLMALFVLSAAVAAFAALGLGTTPSSKGGHATTPPVLKHVAKAAPLAAATATPVVKTTVISAPRGRCWLSIRTGGANGPIVYEGVLEQGKTLHFTLKHALWMRMGRPDNLDISLAGRNLHRFPATPANVLLTRTGAQTA